LDSESFLNPFALGTLTMLLVQLYAEHYEPYKDNF
jgi:hypothetical protein